jgi:hypothetical protein
VSLNHFVWPNILGQQFFPLSLRQGQFLCQEVDEVTYFVFCTFTAQLVGLISLHHAISYNHIVCSHQVPFHLFRKLRYSFEGSREAELSPKGQHISAAQLEGCKARSSTATTVEHT